MIDLDHHVYRSCFVESLFSPSFRNKQLYILKNRITIIHWLSYHLLNTLIKYFEIVSITSTDLSHCHVNNYQCLQSSGDGSVNSKQPTHPPEHWSGIWHKVTNVPPWDSWSIQKFPWQTWEQYKIMPYILKKIQLNTDAHHLIYSDIAMYSWLLLLPCSHDRYHEKESSVYNLVMVWLWLFMSNQTLCNMYMYCNWFKYGKKYCTLISAQTKTLSNMMFSEKTHWKMAYMYLCLFYIMCLRFT